MKQIDADDGPGGQNGLPYKSRGGAESDHDTEEGEESESEIDGGTFYFYDSIKAQSYTKNTQLRFICLHLYSVLRNAEIDLALTLISKFDLALIKLFGRCCASETKSVHRTLKMTSTSKEILEQKSVPQAPSVLVSKRGSAAKR